MLAAPAGSISVQQVLEEKLSSLSGPTPPSSVVADDTGVHASAFYAHFEWEGEFGSRFANWEQGCWKLNGMLPPDIGVRRIFEVGERTRAFSAAERAYTYWVHTGKDPSSRAARASMRTLT